jgi:pyrrolidone-carboxylate peptidase
MVFAHAPASAHPPGDVILDTESELAWAQYQANLAFARSYRPRSRAVGGRPRVLLTGFGRFGAHPRNASGMIACRWVGRPFLESDPPTAGAVASPGSQLAVIQETVSLAGLGEVEICAMVLPVAWDLAAVLVLREAEAFAPDLVVMNGIAAERQPLWLELGALNRAKRAADASAILEPRDPTIIAGAAPSLGNRASFSALAASAAAAIAAEKDLSTIAPGAVLAPARPSNGYLCNSTTYAVGHGMSRPGERIVLLEASHPRGSEHGLAITLERDLSRVPRLFVHWPSAIEGDGLDAATRVSKAIVACQLTTAEPPIGGDEVESGDVVETLGETF